MSEAAPTLEQLRELPLPPAISPWPQTWGWAVLAVVTLLILAVLAVRFALRWRRNRYRREALAELALLEQGARDDIRQASALPALLKRTALSALPEAARSKVAALHGQEWLDYLNAQAPVFAADSAALLRLLAYAPPQIVTLERSRIDQLFVASRQWMERHHVAA